jgi:hypothetical protein
LGHQLFPTNPQLVPLPSHKKPASNRKVNIDNSSFERVEQFKYLGTTLTKENSIHEEIKSRLKSRNSCYHSVQNFLSSNLLSKNTKLQTIICFMFFSGQFPGVLILYVDVSEHSVCSIFMEKTECFETSEYKIQAPGNYAEESIQHSEHGKSLKSRKP